MNTDMLVLLLIFQNISCYCQMITWMKNANNLWTSKVQPQSIAQHLLNFFANFSLTLLIKVILIKNASSEAYCRKTSLMLRVSHNTSIQIKLFICREIVSYSLPSMRNSHQKNLIPREKCPQRIAPNKPPLPENSLQGIKPPFRKFTLYSTPNMIG